MDAAGTLAALPLAIPLVLAHGHGHVPAVPRRLRVGTVTELLLGVPLCWMCRDGGQIFRHRHCPYCRKVVPGTDIMYVDHAWKCEGPS